MSTKVQPSTHQQGSLNLHLGRKRLKAPYTAISHISVIDHYCYIHYEKNGAWHKMDFAMSLKQLLTELNDDFLLVHRAHVVNLSQIQQVRALNRTLELQRKNAMQLPVSRGNKTRLLSRLEIPTDPS